MDKTMYETQLKTGGKKKLFKVTKCSITGDVSLYKGMTPVVRAKPQHVAKIATEILKACKS